MGSTRSKPVSKSWRNSTFALIALLFCLLFGSCSTPGIKLDRDSGNVRRKAYAQAFAPFAAMSALAYAQDENADADDKKLRAALESSLTNSPTPWLRDTRFAPTEAATNQGLAYDVWVNKQYGTPVVVIAVRGTEFTDIQDWKSNLYWLTRFFSKTNQYECAPGINEIGRVFAAYAKEPETIFITTGHSLGGGVAQCLLYAFPKQVVQCYAFNPSPVTAFYSQSKDNQNVYNEMLPVSAFPSHRTLRVYEKGEVLAHIRAQLRWFYPLDDKIMEVRWNFDEKRNVVKNHGILGLATKIHELAEDTTIPEPSPLYRPWWRTPKNTTVKALTQLPQAQ